MEKKYIGIFTIVENEHYKIFKDCLICPLCHNIFFEPYIVFAKNAFIKQVKIAQINALILLFKDLYKNGRFWKN